MPSTSPSHEDALALRRSAAECPPRTPDELHSWLRCMLDLDIPRTARIEGHAAPFDYLCHAYFEDQRTHRNAIVWASRGSGKTMLGAVATLLDMLYKPGIEVCILGGSFAQSSRMHEHLCRLLHREPLCHIVEGSITRTHVSLVNGSRVQVISQSQRAVRGLRAHRLRCDEVEHFTPEVWEAAQLITRSGRCGEIDVRAGIEALSTMHKPFGLMNTLVRSADRIDARLFRWNVIDVLEHCEDDRDCDVCSLYPEVEGGCLGLAKIEPDPHRKTGFFHIDDAIDQRSRASDLAWQSEMLCSRPDVTDCVYREFDERRHVFDDRTAPRNDASIQWIGGIDFGYRAPTAVLLAMLDGGNTLHVMDEFIESGCRTQTVIDRVREKFSRFNISTAAKAGVGVGRFRFFGVDPAGLQRSDQSGVSTVSLWRRAGFIMRTRAMPVESGIEAVRARLSGSSSGAGGGLRVHERCVKLIRALREYHYPPEMEEDLPPMKDGPDHACDALRYMIANLDGRSCAVTVRKY